VGSEIVARARSIVFVVIVSKTDPWAACTSDSTRLASAGENVFARVLAGAGGSIAYEFAGARVYTYRELVRTVADRIRARPRLVPLRFALWRILASGAEFLPGSPLTRNQLALMQRDNIASADCPGLSSLDIAPTEIETLVSAVMDRS
jgi:hypothetical protein